MDSKISQQNVQPALNVVVSKFIALFKREISSFNPLILDLVCDVISYL